MSAIEFTSSPGKSFTVIVRNPGNSYSSLATGIACTEVTSGRYRATLGSLTGIVWIEATAGATKALGFADLDNPAANSYSDVVDAIINAEAIAAAVAESGVTLSDDNVTAIALAVYRRLVGGSVGVLAGPTSGDPLDVPLTADFEYTFDADVAADSSLVFTIRRDVADVDAVLEIVDDELVTVDGDDAEFTDDAEVERLSATSCRVTIRARSLQLVDPGVYVAEFRELTVSDETISKHEVGLAVRRSPSRRIAE